jgi:RNA polymerase sigma factor (sigma-70 family)
MALEPDQQIADVVTREHSRLKHFIRRRVPDPRDAEDILQDVFYELVEANRLLMPIDHVTGWLYRVARNRITDLFRKKRPEALGDAVVADDGDELRLEDLLPSPDAGPRRSTCAVCCSKNSKRPSTNCRQSSARSLWRTNWTGAVSRKCPRRAGPT